MIRKCTIMLWCCLLAFASYAQETAPINGVADPRPGIHAFTNATIHTDYQTSLENATLLIIDGKVSQVGTSVSIPAGAIVTDLQGMHIYPSFVDPYTSYGLPPVKRGPGFNWNAPEQIKSNEEGAYNINEAIKSDYQAFTDFHMNAKKAGAMRKSGFGTVLSLRKDGIARGTSVVVTLAESSDHEVIIKDEAAAHFSLNRGTSSQYYPVSIMGAVALLRQTHLDARWYQEQNPGFYDIGLERLNSTASLPQVFEASNWMDSYRAGVIGKEFGLRYIVKGSGDEYKRISTVKGLGYSYILPLNFPEAMDVEDAYDALDVTLEQLKHWELAPTNPAALRQAGINIAFTADGASDFMGNLRKAIEHGLSEQDALAALTANPARMIGVSDQVGSLKSGMLANFLITSGAIFDNETVIYENWVQGMPYVLADKDARDIAGAYELTVAGTSYQLEVSGKPGKQKGKIVVNDSTSIDVKIGGSDELISLSFNPDTSKEETAQIRLSGYISNRNWKGNGQGTDGSWLDWTAQYTGELETEKPEGRKPEQAAAEGAPEAASPELGQVTFPLKAYGLSETPQQETILITNATVWTNEAEGILEATDVLIRDGKIAEMGKNLPSAGARVIDGTGKHLTAGIIDEHSHIALSSVNDVATNSSMVRMSDVVDSEDIDIYRQLAGGVTAAQLLHGSANPIGGQSAIIKLRWGSGPDEMLINNADPFIKFALGENVKRSRSAISRRYPQTRMGVEQVYVDAFSQAKAYMAEWDAYNKLPRKTKASTPAPRKILELEALAEILRSERFISCHSYVQSEINMLMHVAEDFGFRVNTFTHILEGYKVADKMAAHGAGGSTFADWWAYKREVVDAIPYNPTLMHNEGVVVAVNSDNNEMARRLNQEAAKSIKYGGMAEEDALKMVTLNPAKLLHLDDRMGSIKVGKDGDVVIWSDHPLSIYAMAEKTLIDGTVYFDREADATMRSTVEAERNRLIQKMRSAGPPKGGKGMKRPWKKIWDCEDVVIEGFDHLIGEE